jgi:hypothetical protein
MSVAGLDMLRPSPTFLASGPAEARPEMISKYTRCLEYNTNIVFIPSENAKSINLHEIIRKGQK